ncbi:sigma-54-dependent Fis family transcriptional regulator [Shewanella profunda]|nr:sigma-54-dependent Fis family transcriptional regulator [Shewanella profunda]
MSFLGQRIYLTDLFSHGLQRMELCRTLGVDVTKSIIIRSGFAKGWLIAERLKRQMPDAWAEARNGKLGPLLCSMYGFGEVLSSKRRDGIKEKPLVETYFIGLYEAEQHLRLSGISDEVVCWEQIGFASGYVSNVEGRTVYFIEDECKARGDDYCHLRGNYLEEWGDEITPFLPFYGNISNESVECQLYDALKWDESLPKSMQDRINYTLKLGNPEEGYPVSSSYAMQALLDMAANVAKVPTSVLVTGESGVGKEKLVKFIHDNSPRKNKPFIAINCGALAENLLENELFGHAKGAYTGADSTHIGLIESANGGTLFLDEVGELSPQMQVKLLRVLQEKELRKIGDNKTIKVDIRVLSATNKNLEHAVELGEFRQDLYYRLKVIELVIPPLRERREDILPLCRYFLNCFNQSHGKEYTGFSHKTADLLLS